MAVVPDAVCGPGAEYFGLWERSSAFGEPRWGHRRSRRGIAETNPTGNHEVVGSIPGLAPWVKGSGVAVSCGVSRRRGLDPMLLWLWCRPAATALMGSS